MIADAGFMAALPAKALLRDVRAFGLRADQGCVARAMAFAEGVAARRQRQPQRRDVLVVPGVAVGAPVA